MMVSSTERTELATIETTTGELKPAGEASRAKHEVEAAFVIAKRFPRNEDEAYQKIIKSCNRSTFAAQAVYQFPRGGVTVKGPSVNMAREAARVWGNIEFGFEITHEDEQSRLIEGYAIDRETNTRVKQSDEFKKLVQRKRGGKTEWVTPDERDLRELTNRRAAILYRNCVLQLIPRDYIDEAMEICEQVIKSRVSKDPDGERKRVIKAFSEIGVSPEMLESYLKHSLSQSSPAEIADLRTIFQSIKDGHSKWSEYIKDTKPQKNSVDDLNRKFAANTETPVDAEFTEETAAPQPTDTTMESMFWGVANNKDSKAYLKSQGLVFKSASEYQTAMLEFLRQRYGFEVIDQTVAESVNTPEKAAAFLKQFVAFRITGEV
jgi:hypothetical protein